MPKKTHKIFPLDKIRLLPTVHSTDNYKSTHSPPPRPSKACGDDWPAGPRQAQAAAIAAEACPEHPETPSPHYCVENRRNTQR